MRRLFRTLIASTLAPLAVAAQTSESRPDTPQVPEHPSTVTHARAGSAASDTTAVVRWNVLARRLWNDVATRFGAAQAQAATGDRVAVRAARSAAPPPFPLRYMAALGAAQYEAAQDATAKGAPARARGAAIADASAAVLQLLLPDSVSRATIAAAHAGARGNSAGTPVQVRAVTRFMAWVDADRHDVRWTGTVPAGPGMWRSAPGDEPVLAAMPQWRPWVMERADQFRPAPPPAYGSPTFDSAITEVRRIARTRTPEQTRIARRWDMAQPLDAWNGPAVDALMRAHAGELEAARALALLNIAINEAGLACWDAKYHYWLLRPSQADSSIAFPVGIGLPNFPSYPAGHACVAGAAAEVIGAVAPAARAAADSMAAEEAISRLYAGVHYRFDGDTGLALGRRVARSVLAADARGRFGAGAAWRAGADGTR